MYLQASNEPTHEAEKEKDRKSVRLLPSKAMRKRERVRLPSSPHPLWSAPFPRTNTQIHKQKDHSGKNTHHITHK